MRWKQILNYPCQIVRSLGHTTIDFIYPPYCTICNARLSASEILICNNCWSALPQIAEDCDLRDSIKSGLREEICFSKAFSIWEFSPPIQSAIHHLKYQNLKALAKPIGSFMAERLKKLLLPIDNTVLIPVPLHKTRIRERGYNQSALLCQVIASKTDYFYSSRVLKRVRYTRSQTKLNTVDRAKNVKNAFKVISSNEINNKIAVLIDDVITTGSTMNECARVLMDNGAKCVYLFSMAKA